MTNVLSQCSIVLALADQAAHRITKKVISEMQKMTHLLSGDDSGLKTTWDEICVQVQDEPSFYWDTYDEVVRSVVARNLGELPKHEREALWLQTPEGSDWDCEDEQDREPYPVADDDIIEYLTSEYIYAEAREWSNTRIRAFLDSSARRD